MESLLSPTYISHHLLASPLSDNVLFCFVFSLMPLCFFNHMCIEYYYCRWVVLPTSECCGNAVKCSENVSYYCYNHFQNFLFRTDSSVQKETQKPNTCSICSLTSAPSKYHRSRDLGEPGMNDTDQVRVKLKVTAGTVVTQL